MFFANVGPLVAAGFGMAFTMPAATAAIIEAAPPEHAGIASGVLNASRQAGGAIGIALLGTLIARTEFVPGFHAAMAVSAGSFLLAALVTAAAVERRRRYGARSPLSNLTLRGVSRGVRGWHG